MGEGTRSWAYHETDHFRAERYKFIPPAIGGKELVRLHLGCGKRKYRGYVNIDSGGSPDLVCDITALPFKPETVSEILAVHVFEHLFPWKVEAVLTHWYSLLVPGGKLIMEMPDLNKVLEHFKNPKMPVAMTMCALYGGDQSERIEDLHKWAWNFVSLEPLIKKAGFTSVVEKLAQFHVPERDFIIEGTK